MKRRIKASAEVSHEDDFLIWWHREERKAEIKFTFFVIGFFIGIILLCGIGSLSR